MPLSQRGWLRRLLGMDTQNMAPPRIAEPHTRESCDRVWDEFQAALQQLPALPRLAFLLSEVLGKPMDEVATLLGRDGASCRQLIDDARSRLRALHASAHGDTP
ncbi:DNA-directed RNA polymerase specialized sigma24 family protein [Luteibacter sp. 621]